MNNDPAIEAVVAAINDVTSSGALALDEAEDCLSLIHTFSHALRNVPGFDHRAFEDACGVAELYELAGHDHSEEPCEECENA